MDRYPPTDLPQHRQTIVVETLESGQPRAYADERRVERVTVTSSARLFNHSKHEWYMTDTTPSKYFSERKAVALVAANYPLPGEPKEWHQTYVSSVVNTAPGVWTITIVSPYLD